MVDRFHRPLHPARSARLTDSRCAPAETGLAKGPGATRTAATTIAFRASAGPISILSALGEVARTIKGTDAAPGFAETLRVLFEIRLDAMTRTGHHKTMVRLLEQVLQDSRAAKLEEEVYERNRP